jgi:hypothetical protein
MMLELQPAPELRPCPHPVTMGTMNKDVWTSASMNRPGRFLARQGQLVKITHCNTFPDYPYTFETISGPFEAWCGHREDFTEVED